MIGKDPLDMDISGLPREAIVIDLIYNPIDTDLIKRARLQRKQDIKWSANVGISSCSSLGSRGLESKPDVTKELLHLLEKALQ